jgi:hypothetical protein
MTSDRHRERFSLGLRAAAATEIVHRSSVILVALCYPAFTFALCTRGKSGVTAPNRIPRALGQDEVFSSWPAPFSFCLQGVGSIQVMAIIEVAEELTINTG